MRFPSGRALFAHLLAIAGLLPAQSGPSQTLPDLGDSSQVVISPAQERKLGEATMRQVYASGGYLDDPEVVAYLNNLGRRLVLATSASRQDFEFFAINDPGINAFALPGGFIGVHTGLILLTQNESELASVLAHEISHVTQLHIARMIAGEQKNQLATLAAMAIAVLAARSRPDMASAAVLTAQGLSRQYQLDFTRENELEADRIAFQVLDKAGFDTRAMSMMFIRLQRAVRVYENNGKTFQERAPVTHVHMCIPLPKGRSYYRFISVFSRLYDSLIYPVPLPVDEARKLVNDQMTIEDLKQEPREIQGTQTLNFKPGQVDDELSHPNYSVKQLVNEAVLRSRFFASRSSKVMKGGKF